MTRWDLLKDLLMSCDTRRAIGKAWPLFFFLIFHMGRSNGLKVSYFELKSKMGESPNTIKNWRDHLVKNRVVKVAKGKTSMTFSVLSPFDSLVTCVEDDLTKVKAKSDPVTRRILDMLSNDKNNSLFPVIVELASKIDKLEKKLIDVD